MNHRDPLGPGENTLLNISGFGTFFTPHWTSLVKGQIKTRNFSKIFDIKNVQGTNENI